MRLLQVSESILFFVSVSSFFGFTHMQPVVAADDRPKTIEKTGTYSDSKTGDSKPLRWRARIGSVSGPLVASRGRLLIGTNNSHPRDPKVSGDAGILMCFSTDGEFQWQSVHSKLSSRNNDIPGLGIQSGPVVDGSMVYFVSNRGELVCLDLEGFHDMENDGDYKNERHQGLYDADIIWVLDMVRDLGVFKRDALDVRNPIASPLIVGDLVYCVTGNGSSFGTKLGRDGQLVPRPDAPSIIAVEKASGKLVWSKAIPGPNIMFGQWASPVCILVEGHQQILFPGGDGILYALHPETGDIVWSVDCNPSGATSWSSERRGSKNFFVSAPTVSDETVYVGVNQDLGSPSTFPRPLYAIDARAATQRTGRAIKWRFEDKDFDGTLASVVVDGDVAYTLSENGKLIALNRWTGKVDWRAELEEGACLYCAPYCHGESVYACAASHLVVFGKGSQKRFVNRYDFGGVLQSAPVVIDDVLFIATDEYLCAAASDSWLPKAR